MKQIIPVEHIDGGWILATDEGRQIADSKGDLLVYPTEDDAAQAAAELSRELCPDALNAEPVQGTDGLWYAAVGAGLIGPAEGASGWESQADCALFCAGWNGGRAYAAKAVQP